MEYPPRASKSFRETERRAELVRAAKVTELGSFKKLDVFDPRRDCNASKQLVRTRWVLTWEMVDGRKSVKARLAAEGYQNPELQKGIADTSGYVSPRSSHLQVISKCAIKKSGISGMRFCQRVDSRGKFSLRRPLTGNSCAAMRYGNSKRGPFD